MAATGSWLGNTSRSIAARRTIGLVLAEAIKACRQYGAKLVIAKIDRLSRDAHFLLGLEKAGIDFVAADMPNTNRLTVGIMAMVAQGRTSHDLRANQGGIGGRKGAWS
jgi:hypothetical protein